VHTDGRQRLPRPRREGSVVGGVVRLLPVGRAMLRWKVSCSMRRAAELHGSGRHHNRAKLRESRVVFCRRHPSCRDWGRETRAVVGGRSSRGSINQGRQFVGQQKRHFDPRRTGFDGAGRGRDAMRRKQVCVRGCLVQLELPLRRRLGRFAAAGDDIHSARGASESAAWAVDAKAPRTRAPHGTVFRLASHRATVLGIGRVSDNNNTNGIDSV
jgi:hypothetical protein